MIVGKMLNSDRINFNSNNFTFKGELENRFFKAVKDKNKREQLAILNNIKFNVFERDVNTGNNFLHVACLDGSAQFLQKALKLLRVNKEKIETIINTLNSDNKYPLDYLKDNKFKQTIYSLVKSGQIPTLQSENINNDDNTVSDKNFGNVEIPQNEKVGNEIEQHIDISDFSFADEDLKIADSSIPNGLDSIVGLDYLKQIFQNEIIEPLNNNRNVFSNGFLLHGLSGNGKTFAIEKLAESLGRNIIDASLIISTSEKNPAELNELIENNFIRINPDEIREIGLVSSILKKYFLETNKQGFVFMDEIQKFFPVNSTYVNNVRAMQAIENSARNGMILLATTNDIEEINPLLLNSLRFEKLIELKPPRKEECKALISKIIKDPYMLSQEEITLLSKKMNGLSYNDITRIIEGTCYKTEHISKDHVIQELENYAKIHNIQDLSDEGTTSNYDTFQKRVLQSVNSPTSLDDVIGMDEVKKKLRQAFAPVKKDGLFRSFFKENKIKKPNGILLYGPPGCGKTFIMSAIAAETKLPMYQVKLSDVGSSYVNQTEKNIKKIFDQLRKKYRETGEASILFFDECDSMFAKSENSSNRSLLNTLKEEMNNAGDDGIFVVAATNEKDSLNTAIVRDGRFDTKIEVGYPDEKARIGLIKYALRSTIFSGICTEENIKEFAKLTKGLSNASITIIFSTLEYNKAAEMADKISSQDELERFIAKSPIKIDEIKTAILNKKQEINKMNLKQKNIVGLDWLDKTAAYDEFLDRTSYSSNNDPKSLNDVIGMDDVKTQMKLKILAPLNPVLKKYYEENRIPASNGIILHGPGGVGKTFIIKALAAEAKIPLYELNLSEQGSSYINETSGNIKKIFNQLKRKFKETGEASILFLDEADSLLGKVSGRGSADSERMNILNTLKEELANASDNGIVVVAATNNYGNLDPNVVRSGRFNDHIKIGYPDAAAREAYLINILKSRKISEKIVDNQEQIKELTEFSEGMSNADIKAAIEHAVISSQTDFVDKVLSSFKDDTNKESNIGIKPITFEDIKNAILRKKQEIEELRNQNNISAGVIYENFGN